MLDEILGFKTIYALPHKKSVIMPEYSRIIAVNVIFLSQSEAIIDLFYQAETGWLT